MFWLGFWITVCVVGACGVAVTASAVAFERRVHAESSALLASAAEPARIDRARWPGLPAAVARYAQLALGRSDRPVRSVRLVQRGGFRPKLDGAWMSIRGEQYFSADPPAFVWWGRVRAAPGVWIDARDRVVAGEGNMLVKLASAITLADSSGPELDQGALLRLLGEMPWFPSALFDPRYVSWEAIDERRARATLRLSGREVSGVFEFGADGLPARFTCERYRDLGGGKSELTPFLGESSDYRQVDGMLVPHRVVGSWYVGGRFQPYARFEVERVEYDAPDRAAAPATAAALGAVP
jgi:hypothetical protein